MSTRVCSVACMFCRESARRDQGQKRISTAAAVYVQKAGGWHSFYFWQTHCEATEE